MDFHNLSSVAQYPSAWTVHPCSRMSTSSTCNKSHKTLPADGATCHFKPLLPGWARVFPLNGWSLSDGNVLWIHVSSPVTTKCRQLLLLLHNAAGNWDRWSFLPHCCLLIHEAPIWHTPYGTGAQIFQKSSNPSKFYTPERWHEESFKLRIHKYYMPLYKI